MVAKRRDHSSNTETDDGDNGHKRWFVSVVSSNDDECSTRECYVDGGSDDAGNAEAFILQGPQVFRVLAWKARLLSPGSLQLLFSSFRLHHERMRGIFASVFQ